MNSTIRTSMASLLFLSMVHVVPAFAANPPLSQSPEGSAPFSCPAPVQCPPATICQPPPPRCDPNLCGGCPTQNTIIDCPLYTHPQFNDGTVDRGACITYVDERPIDWIGAGSAVFTIGTEVGYAWQNNHTGGQFMAQGLVAGQELYRYCKTTIWTANGVRLNLVCGHFRNGADGCFDPSTRILKHDGSVVTADEIRAGDILYSPSRADGVRVIRVIAGPETAELLQLSTESNQIVVTRDHPFVSTTRFLRADELRVGDEILDGNGDATRVTKIESYGPYAGQKVVNFVLDTEAVGDGNGHLLVAEGLMSGDLVLQKSDFSVLSR